MWYKSFFFLERGIPNFGSTEFSFFPCFSTRSERRENCWCFLFRILFRWYSQCFTSLSLCTVYCIFCGTLLWPLWCVDVSFLFCSSCLEFIMKQNSRKPITKLYSLCFYSHRCDRQFAITDFILDFTNGTLHLFWNSLGMFSHRYTATKVSLAIW